MSKSPSVGSKEFFKIWRRRVIDGGQDGDIFTEDLRRVHASLDPILPASVDLIYAFSGRGTALGNNADNLNRPEDEIDLADDGLRFQHAIKAADQVNALRTKKHLKDLLIEDRITPIFYNGRSIHNQDLEAAIKEGRVNYPASQIIIKPIEPQNTLGQVRSFLDFLENDPRGKGIKTLVTCSSAYHLPRIARLFSQDSPAAVDVSGKKNALAGLKIFCWGVDREYLRPGINRDLYGEAEAMKNYSAEPSPTIAREIGKGVVLCEGWGS